MVRALFRLYIWNNTADLRIHLWWYKWEQLSSATPRFPRWISDMQIAHSTRSSSLAYPVVCQRGMMMIGTQLLIMGPDNISIYPHF
jgi:hypothetical protein